MPLQITAESPTNLEDLLSMSVSLEDMSTSYAKMLRITKISPYSPAGILADKKASDFQFDANVRFHNPLSEF